MQECSKYIKSPNLKGTYKFKDHVYRLLSNVEDNFLTSYDYFCGGCRNIFSSTTPSGATCPTCGLKHCNHKSDENESNYYQIGLDEFDIYDIDRLRDSITINKSFNQENEIRDINITLLYHTYRIESDLKHQKSWQHYDRLLFNFETKQVYYTQKLLLSKKVDFSHLKIWETRMTSASKFSIAMQDVIKEIYDVYGISCNTPSWQNATPPVLRTPKLTFMCLKFPAMMNYAYDLWLSYPHRKNTSNELDMQVAMIYWSCNYDRVLKKALTSTNEKEYIERTNEIIGRFTSDSNVIANVRNNPLYVVFARFMYQLGFRSFHSVKRLVEMVSAPGAHKEKRGIWIHDILCARMHVRNKMYRRFLKYHSEDAVLDMLSDTLLKCTYSEFFDGYSYRTDMYRFYDCVEHQFGNIDFSEDITDIFHDIV